LASATIISLGHISIYFVKVSNSDKGQISLLALATLGDGTQDRISFICVTSPLVAKASKAAVSWHETILPTIN
jgi:hypothetical protein